jgi:hypothetical protein
MTIPESIQPVPEYPVVTPKKDSGLAIASLVCGIAAWIIFPIVAAIAAVITGHLAKKEIRESGKILGGDGMALAGLLMGYIQLGLFVVAIIVVIITLVLLVPTTNGVLDGSSSWVIPFH